METTTKQVKVTKLEPSKYERKFGEKGNDRRYSPSRVFIDIKGETVWEHLSNRYSRDYNAIKPLLAAKLNELGIEFTKLSWNRYAGCSMCACSGGFMIETGKPRGSQLGIDYWASIELVDDEEQDWVIGHA